MEKTNGLEELTRELSFLAKKHKTPFDEIATNFFGYLRLQYDAKTSIYLVDQYYKILKK